MTSSKGHRLAKTLAQAILAASFSAALGLGQGHTPDPQIGGVHPGTQQQQALAQTQQGAIQGAHPPTSVSPELMEKGLNAQSPRKSERPVRQSEIKCAVFSWEARLPIPALTLVCPPNDVFSPIRVYLKFTWKTLGDIPKDISRVVVSAGSQTKIRPAKGDMHVWLKFSDAGDENSTAKWVTFNRLDGVALEGE